MSTARKVAPAALAVLSALTLLLTLIWPQWIEGLTGAEPDGGNGLFELLIAGGLALVAVLCGLDVVLTRRRSRRATRHS